PPATFPSPLPFWPASSSLSSAMLKRFKFVSLDFVGAQHRCAPSRHNPNQTSFRAESAERGIPLHPTFIDRTDGCPTRRFCVWVLGLPFLLLSSRPERPDLFFGAELWRVGPRSGGIMARPNDSPSPVIPNQPSQKTMVIPSEARCGFPSHAFCAMNLLFLLSSRVDHMPSRSPLSCRVPHTPVLRVGLGFASSCFVIPIGATAPYAVAEWRDRGNT